MQGSEHADIVGLRDAFDAAESDARSLAGGLSEELATWRTDPGSWSVAECLDHLATANRAYLSAMRPPSERALARGRVRRGPAEPGLIGRLFVRSFEPPVKPYLSFRAPQNIRPRAGQSLAPAAAAFFESQEEVRAYLFRYAGIDLAGVRFTNPFIHGVRFSLATGLHVLAAHERRHLAQGWRVRRAAEEGRGAAGDTGSRGA